MGAGFTRRYNYFPGTSVITYIEGIILLDLPPPGNIQGIQTGIVCLVAEFVDNTYAVAVDANGNVTQSPQPVQIFSGQDLLNKVGGFDPTLGDFGGSMGNGFVELRNKQFAGLVLVPVPNASSKAVRTWRKLPFNQDRVTPSPITPMQAGTVNAGTQFLNGTQRVNAAAPVQFTGFLPYIAGIDGAISNSVGATETFNSLGGNFVANGVAVGDVICTGYPVTTAQVSSPTGAAAVGSADGSIFCAPGFTGYPAVGLIQIENEQMTYSGITASATGASFTGLTRGVNGTVGATHPIGPVVIGLTNVDTYRIQAVPGATQLTLERQESGNFSISRSFSASAVPWRIHKSTDAESFGGVNAAAGSYTVPARPIDGAVAAATQLPPTSPAPTLTHQNWQPLSGLGMLTDPTTGLLYVAASQGPNPAASPTLDALYTNAIAVMQSQETPAALVNIMWAARKSAVIRQQLNTSVNQESMIGVGRVGVVAPDLQSVTSTSQAVAATDPGVGANRSERVIYSWPPVQTFVPEAVNINIKGSDGRYYQNGIIDLPTDGFLVAVLSNINPEWNPGQADAPVPTVLSPILDFARNAPSTLGINDYGAFKANGICAIRQDRKVGWVFQSGKTTSLISNQTDINRRRFADFCEDSIADALAPKAKKPMSLQLQDDIVTEIDSFCNGLLSPDNPKQSRINAYSVDDVTGNTDQLEEQGIFVVIVNIRMTPTADFIVLQFNVGNNVVTSSQKLAA